MNPIGGPALTIVPADHIVPGDRRAQSFTGVVRPLQDTDRQVVEGLLQARGLREPPLPYVLDCLNVGAMRVDPLRTAPPPQGISRSLLLLLVPVLPVAGLALWNVVRGVRRLRNPLLHPVYATLARYGHPAAVERSIEADARRGSQRLRPAEITPGWLLLASFWSVEAVPLDWIVWIYRPRRLRLGRGMLIHFLIASHTLVFFDRMGRQHAVRGADGTLDGIVAAVTRGRSWMETGFPNPLREQYGLDKAGFLAAVEARRQAMTGGTIPPALP